MSDHRYLYCVADGLPDLTDCPAGLDGLPVYALARGETSAVLSPVARHAFAPEPAALHAHEAVIESVMAQTTVLPARFGSVLPSEAAVLDALDRRHDEFRRAMARVAGKVEFGLKVMRRPEEASFPGAEPSGESDPTLSPARLRMLRAAHRALADRRLLASAEAFASLIGAHLREGVADAHVRLLPTAALVLSAAYLVSTDRIEWFGRTIDGLKEEIKGCVMLVSGPWPPYHFVETNRGKTK